MNTIITFSINSNAVRAGTERRAQMSARSDFAAMKLRTMTQQCDGCSIPTCTSSIHNIAPNIAPMQQISFPGIVRACTSTANTAATAVVRAVTGQMADQYAIGNENAPPKHGIARFVELVYGVAVKNDVSGRPGKISTLLGPSGHYERLGLGLGLVHSSRHHSSRQP